MDTHGFYVMSGCYLAWCKWLHAVPFEASCSGPKCCDIVVDPGTSDKLQPFPHILHRRAKGLHAALYVVFR